jgi:hypothetical protein
MAIEAKLKLLLPVIASGLAFSCSGPAETTATTLLPTGIVDDRSKLATPSDEYQAIVARY